MRSFTDALLASELQQLMLVLLLMLAAVSTAVLGSHTAAAVSNTDDSLPDADVARLRAALRHTILSRTARDEHGQAFRPLVAAFVRLAFQACLGGQCTGCVDIASGAGANLNSTVRLLVDLRQRVGVRVSYGDLFALAGLVALNVGEEIAAERRGGEGLRNITHAIRFQQGRVDCATAPYSVAGERVKFPSSDGGLEHVISWFLLEFGFGAKQTVAIMGLHKLGGLKRHAHTFDLFAQWSFAPDALDNGYYQDLVGVDDWQPRYVRVPSGSSEQQQQHPPSPPQSPSLLERRQASSLNGAATTAEKYVMWRRQSSDTGLMFSCDISLYKDVPLTTRGHRVVSECSYDRCPLSKTSSIAVAFARDNDLWLRTVSAAFAAMLDRGCR